MSIHKKTAIYIRGLYFGIKENDNGYRNDTDT